MILEIRTYRLRPGTRDEFVRVMRDESLPLLEEFGIQVVDCGTSLVAEDGHEEAYLIRASRRSRLIGGRRMRSTPATLGSTARARPCSRRSRATTRSCSRPRRRSRPGCATQDSDATEIDPGQGSSDRRLPRARPGRRRHRPQRIVALYDALAQLTPSPVGELNRAVAVGIAFGPDAALELVDALSSEPALRGYDLRPTCGGDLLARFGRDEEGRASSSAGPH